MPFVHFFKCGVAFYAVRYGAHIRSASASFSIIKTAVMTSIQSHQQRSRINDALYAIHQNIAGELSARQLARTAAYSEQHFHRLFKQVVGESVNHYIRRTRLELAANQLMFDSASTVLAVAQKCGFHSLSSFSQRFKHAFGVSPGQWRTTEVRQSPPPFMNDMEIANAYQRLRNLQLPTAELVELPDRHVAYVRHQGYGRDIRLAWQILQAWARAEGRDFDQQWGLHHSNPAWVPLNECRYVACLGLDRPQLCRGVVNSLTIPGGLHAAFELSGVYGELLPYLSHILERWLPASGFKMQTTPAFVHYHKNHFLRADECFELTFYLPVSLF